MSDPRNAPRLYVDDPDLDASPTLIVDWGALGADDPTRIFDDGDRAAAVADRGWGPRQVPGELRTTAWQKSSDGKRLEPSPAGRLTTALRTETYRARRSRPARRSLGSSRGALIAAICGVAGVTAGAAVGVASSRGGDAPAPVVVAAPGGEAAPALAANARVDAVETPAPASVAHPPPRSAGAERAAAPAHHEVVAVEAAVVEAPVEVAPIEQPPPDPIEDARAALLRGDLEAAEDALMLAREAGDEPLELARIEAQLAVQRGDGARSVARLRELTSRYQDAGLWVALGRTLAQAEQDSAAAEAFTSALSIEPRNVHAHVGITRIRVHRAAVSAARRALQQAEQAAGGSPEPAIAARVHVASAVVLFERARLGAAAAQANLALALDAGSSEAHLMLARIALERREDATAHLEAAVAGRAPHPMALALLASRTDDGRGCSLAASYLERAPEGFDARRMRRMVRGCEPRGRRARRAARAAR